MKYKNALMLITILFLIFFFIAGCGIPVYSGSQSSDQGGEQQGTECTTGQEKCVAQEYYKCEDSSYVNKGKVEGKCGYTKPEPQQPAQTTVQTIGEIYLSGKNWDADPEADGLEFDLRPKDRNDKLIETDGTVEIKLWKLECTEESYGYCIKEECTKKSGDLIETWSIPIKKQDYSFMGVTVRAEYQKYNPAGKDKYKEVGCAEVTLITPDGKTFTSLDDRVYMIGF